MSSASPKVWSARLRGGFFEPLTERLRKSPRRAYWRDLERSQWLSTTEIRELQWRRCQDMLRFTYERNAFYRARFEEAGVRPSAIHAPSDLARLPVLTKTEVRAQGERMISTGFRPEDLMEMRTGGSTGQPLRMQITEDCSERRNAAARRHDRWSGWNVGEPMAAVWGNPKPSEGMRALYRQWLYGPHLVLDTMAVNERAVREFAGRWARVRPSLLFGHAHSIHVLAGFVEALGLSSVGPRAIVSSSMTLLEPERKTIERVFGRPVHDRYGCEEVGLVGSECDRHDGLHVNAENVFLEILGDDGRPAPSGVEGRIVVTDLVNRAMPFVRYQIEDLGTLHDRGCACGRGLPLMGKVTGRLADFLVKRDGTRVAGISLIENTLTSIPHLSQMQVIQDSLDLVRIRVVPASGFGAAERERLVRYFRDLFDGQVEVRLEELREIPSEGPAGKFRFCISRVGAGSAPADA